MCYAEGKNRTFKYMKGYCKHQRKFHGTGFRYHCRYAPPHPTACSFKGTNSSQQLDTHYICVHSRGSKVECRKCSKQFDSLNLLRKHNCKVNCDAPKQTTCNQCGKHYKHWGAHDNHVSKVHGGITTSGRTSKKWVEPVIIVNTLKTTDNITNQASTSRSKIPVKKKQMDKKKKVPKFSTDDNDNNDKPVVIDEPIVIKESPPKKRSKKD